MKTCTTCAIVLALINGCNLAPTKEEWHNGDFNGPPNVAEETTSWIHEFFFDPESARIVWIEDPPQKTCYHPGAINEKYYGWSWFVDVNAKNRYGGYVGKKTYLLFKTPNGGLISREGAHFLSHTPQGDNLGAVQFYFREEHL